MKKTILDSRALLIFFLLLLNSCGADLYIRVNQLGFLPEDYKSAVILSGKDLTGEKYYITNSKGENIFEGAITSSKGEYGNFNYVHTIIFSNIQKEGKYKIVINDRSSVPFEISNTLYNTLIPTLLDFYKVQRCGYTEPGMHDVCHIADATSIIENGQVVEKQHDVTGGWHDAGDYTKFLNTTAFTTYMLLFSFEFDPGKFGFDNNNNGVPDILEEAKVGLDWLLRAQYNDKFIAQVQDEDDQNVGWRLPEDDPLAFDRPGFVGIGKNLIGIYVAALSLGYRIWKDEIKYIEYADKLLAVAEKYYSIKDRVPDIDSSGTGRYIDKAYEGKLGLGAVELYLSTNKPQLLEEAKQFALQAGSDFWWSWGDVNALVQYKLSMSDKSFSRFIEKNLQHFKEISDSTLFGRGADLSWGTNHAMMGIALQSILYEKITRSGKYRNMGILQRDYILGRNPWGVSFIYEVGENYTRNFHHQVAYFNGGKLPGGFAAGPIKRSIFDEYALEMETRDRFAKFQSESMLYIDDRMDYISNEPTISANATAVFVFGYFTQN